MGMGQEAGPLQHRDRPPASKSVGARQFGCQWIVSLVESGKGCLPAEAPGRRLVSPWFGKTSRHGQDADATTGN
jgi:hypothetical protein